MITSKILKGNEQDFKLLVIEKDEEIDTILKKTFSGYFRENNTNNSNWHKSEQIDKKIKIEFEIQTLINQPKKEILKFNNNILLEWIYNNQNQLIAKNTYDLNIDNFNGYNSFFSTNSGQIFSFFWKKEYIKVQQYLNKVNRSYQKTISYIWNKNGFWEVHISKLKTGAEIKKSWNNSVLIEEKTTYKCKEETFIYNSKNGLLEEYRVTNNNWKNLNIYFKKEEQIIEIVTWDKGQVKANKVLHNKTSINNYQAKEVVKKITDNLETFFDSSTFAVKSSVHKNISKNISLLNESKNQ